MTEEEFRAQMEGIDEGISTKTPPKTALKPFAGGFKKPPQASQVTPKAYSPPKATPRPQGGGQGASRGFSGATLPLVVRQSQKDGSFNLAGRISFSIKVDPEAYDHVTTTGEGLDGKDQTGQYQEGWKVGELTVWPPFNKK